MTLDELDRIVSEIALPNQMRFVTGSDGDLLTIKIRRDDDVCHVTKQPGYSWEGRRWIIEDHYDESHVLRAAWACFISTMEHELREQFVYKGKLPFEAHFDIADVMARARIVR